MRLLLTNDDGIDAEGINVLAKYLSKEHEVWIVAPDSNRSASSHCITMSNPLVIKQLNERIFTCSGMPADCIINGFKNLLDKQPDAVISGINKGANIGTDILYSGTAAAARQAVLYGVPGIALSIESFDNNWQYDAMASFAAKNLNVLTSLCSKEVFVNVNANSALSYKGCRLTVLSKRDYRDGVELFNTTNGSAISCFIGGDVLTQSENNGDFAAVQEGFISVSRVFAEPVAASYTEFVDTEFYL